MHITLWGNADPPWWSILTKDLTKKFSFLFSNPSYLLPSPSAPFFFSLSLLLGDWVKNLHQFYHTLHFPISQVPRLRCQAAPPSIPYILEPLPPYSNLQAFLETSPLGVLPPHSKILPKLHSVHWSKCPTPFFPLASTSFPNLLKIVSPLDIVSLTKKISEASQFF